MPMMAKIVHTAKHTVKAIVDIQSARLWPATAAPDFADMAECRPWWRF
jgi:hypothetical protein